MFDDRDPAFRRARADPRLGPPLLTRAGMVFLVEHRLAFDRYNAFDAHNTEFENTSVAPRLPPPVMLRDGTISFSIPASAPPRA